MAQTGTKPASGFGLADGKWLRGLGQGLNREFKNGITATAGGTKAAALQLPAGVELLEIDTCVTNDDSVLMPAALGGTLVLVRNAGATRLGIYGKGTDQINGAATATIYNLNTNQSAVFFCAKDGQWSAVKTA